MEEDQIAFRLMGLYGKLRRATDAQVRETLKGQIDALLARLGAERRAKLEQQLPATLPEDPPGSRPKR